ncbi:MAG: aminotransferase class III-fold pyridoxal phosphate-dependent enzyme [Vampirovibrionales bacterium]
MGSTPKKVFFGNSGAEAIEGALKLARHYTKRQTIISFYRSFHGRTYGAMSVCASKAIHRRHFSPMMASVQHGHYPYPLRPFFGHRNPEDEAAACLRIYQRPPVQNAGANPTKWPVSLSSPFRARPSVVPPANWLPGLRQLCDEHGVILIADEVQAGVGVPAKCGPASTTASSRTLLPAPRRQRHAAQCHCAKAEIMNWEPGTHATTFGGNPVLLCRSH